MLYLLSLLALANFAATEGAFVANHDAIPLSFRTKPAASTFSTGPPLRPSTSRCITSKTTHTVPRRMVNQEQEEETGPIDVNSIVTCDQLIDYAAKTGVNITLKTLGPGYRAVARATHNSTQVLGYCNGFVRPGGKILHVDTMEVFKPAIKLACEENPEFTNGGTIFGVGFLIGMVCFRHGIDSGCETAQILAIDDGEKQHKRLIRHYKRMGLNVVRYVGEDIATFGDRMIWGGVGTLMTAETKPLLKKWTLKFFSDKDLSPSRQEK